jgi:hypothetical protein
MTFTPIEYTLPEHWACALINGDYSGLDDEESELVDLWLESTSEERGEGHWEIPEFELAGFTNDHDASPVVLACNCLDIVWQKAED